VEAIKTTTLLDCVWSVMAHAQKPDFVFRRNGTSPFKSAGASVLSTTGSRGVRISGSNAGYTMFWGSVKSTGCLLDPPVSPFTCPPVRHRVPPHFNWTLHEFQLYKPDFLGLYLGQCKVVILTQCDMTHTCS